MTATAWDTMRHTVAPIKILLVLRQTDSYLYPIWAYNESCFPIFKHRNGIHMRLLLLLGQILSNNKEKLHSDGNTADMTAQQGFLLQWEGLKRLMRQYWCFWCCHKWERGGLWSAGHVKVLGTSNWTSLISDKGSVTQFLIPLHSRHYYKGAMLQWRNASDTAYMRRWET